MLAKYGANATQLGTSENGSSNITERTCKDRPSNFTQRDFLTNLLFLIGTFTFSLSDDPLTPFVRSVGINELSFCLSASLLVLAILNDNLAR